ncbi:MAG: quinohemoprotein amine dehydrogenase subunit gamma [Clostridia bacterium]|nr:quinohemoprotein amine dehydrogenase subunit gamma [Clostridia bacterium]
MKHIKSLNRGARKAELHARGEKPEVQAHQMPMPCTAVFDPGWESDASGFGTMGLCQPMERDIYGCYGDCWWSAQIPDGLTNFSGWHETCPAASRDWKKLKFVGI